jgi:surface polysaccharide O-acyltransferase-like enzyme
LGADVGFAAAGTAGFFFATAVCLRFAAVRNAFFDGLSKNALGIYALHYAPLVWLQYAMTGFAGFAGVKAAIVFAGTLLASIAAAAALRRVPHGSRLIGESSGGQAA